MKRLILFFFFSLVQTESALSNSCKLDAKHIGAAIEFYDKSLADSVLNVANSQFRESLTSSILKKPFNFSYNSCQAQETTAQAVEEEKKCREECIRETTSPKSELNNFPALYKRCLGPPRDLLGITGNSPLLANLKPKFADFNFENFTIKKMDLGKLERAPCQNERALSERICFKVVINNLSLDTALKLTDPGSANKELSRSEFALDLTPKNSERPAAEIIMEVKQAIKPDGTPGVSVNPSLLNSSNLSIKLESKKNDDQIGELLQKLFSDNTDESNFDGLFTGLRSTLKEKVVPYILGSVLDGPVTAMANQQLAGISWLTKPGVIDATLSLQDWITAGQLAEAAKKVIDTVASASDSCDYRKKRAITAAIKDFSILAGQSSDVALIDEIARKVEPIKAACELGNDTATLLERAADEAAQNLEKKRNQIIAQWTASQLNGESIFGLSICANCQTTGAATLDDFEEAKGKCPTGTKIGMILRFDVLQSFFAEAIKNKSFCFCSVSNERAKEGESCGNSGWFTVERRGCINGGALTVTRGDNSSLKIKVTNVAVSGSILGLSIGDTSDLEMKLRLSATGGALTGNIESVQSESDLISDNLDLGLINKMIASTQGLSLPGKFKAQSIQTFDNSLLVCGGLDPL